MEGAGRESVHPQTPQTSLAYPVTGNLQGLVFSNKHAHGDGYENAYTF